MCMCVYDTKIIKILQTEYFTFAPIKYTNSAVSSVVYFVPLKSRITIRLNPNASHCVVKNLILFK